MKLGTLPGPRQDERIPVVVAPSASHGGPTRQGGYLIYTLEPSSTGAWRIGFELRAFDAEAGAFSTVTVGHLRDPGGAAGAA
jgi:hypothetical protein